MNRWTVILSLFPLLAPAAEPVAVKPVTAGIAEFTAACQAWDGARFATAVEWLRQASTNAPASPTNFYWLGVAEFHRMLFLQNQPSPATNSDAAPGAMEAALAALNRAVKLDPRQAESHALLGTLYGMKIDGNLVRAAWFGPRVEKHRKAALELGANNPRVNYLLGTCQFYTAKKPAALREALATLLQAEKLFEAETRTTPGPLDPRWGHASCLTFIGRTYEQLGQRKEAADYYRKALARQPSDHLAKEGLTRVTRP